MADVSEVANALVQIAEAAVYPAGLAQPSIAVCPVILYQGWPNPQSLDADMAAGKAHVSVYPRPGDDVTSIMMGDTEWTEADNDGTKGSSVREIRRQGKQFQITVWAPTPALRDAIAKPLDVALALSSRFALPDGSQALLSYVNMTQHDESQKMLIYRRDLFYRANYAITQTDPEFVVKQTVLSVAIDPVGATVTVTNP